MKITFFLSFLFYTFLAMAQDVKEINAATYKLCDYFNNMDMKDDSVKLEAFYNEALVPYLRKFEEKEMNIIFNRLFYRLQRNCPEFWNLLTILEPVKDSSQRKFEKQVPTVNQKDIEAFKNQSEFYYLEASGDTTFVSMHNGKWQDKFSDGTYSKCSYVWVNETEFKLFFLKSNNESRLNMSFKGDVYDYQLLTKKDNCYLLSVNVPGQNAYDIFRLYAR